jgi:hypothetical protein
MGKPVARQHLSQLADGVPIALKVRKWHAAILNMKIGAGAGESRLSDDLLVHVSY